MYWQRSLAIQILAIGLICFAGYAITSRFAGNPTAPVRDVTSACPSQTNELPESPLIRDWWANFIVGEQSSDDTASVGKSSTGAR
jgi:hypothetical protein